MFIYTEEKEVNDRNILNIMYVIDSGLKLSIGIHVNKDIHHEGDIFVCSIEMNA